MSQETPTLESSRAEVWHLKRVYFGAGEQRREVKIITQNFNGPCSFIAICNILILRGDIEILPPTRTNVSYEFLSQLVAEYLLKRSPDVDISAALSIMPYTQKGMDLNPVFTSPTKFHPSGQAGGELKLFEQAGIGLFHGWLVEPETREAYALSDAPDYDSSVTLIAEVDHLTKGQLVVDDDAPAAGSSSAPVHSRWTPEERRKIENALVVQQFLNRTQSQLTYHGLFSLIASVQPGTLVALFRNSHLSVLYKRKENEDTSLYHLVTDQVFLNEASIVWERLEDVDGGWASFVDSDFVKSSPAGGDFAGQNAEQALHAIEIAAGMGHPNDEALALQLQVQEDHYAAMLRERYRQQKLLQQQAEQEKKEKKDKKKKSDCVIM